MDAYHYHLYLSLSSLPDFSKRNFFNIFIDMNYILGQNENLILSKEIKEKALNKVRKDFPRIFDTDGLNDSF